jgi:hypothetical protein
MLGGITANIQGRAAQVGFWPQIILGLTASGLWVPLAADADGALIVDPSGGSGGGSNATIVGPLGAQTAAASVATVISGFTANGNTTVNPINVTASGTVAAGMLHIEFILSSDFVGSIGSATINNTSGTNPVGVWGADIRIDKPSAALAYTITGGSAILTAY